VRKGANKLRARRSTELRRELRAVGVNYAQSRTFATPERHLFYDAGAGSTRATIVEFSTKTVQAESVISIGSMQKEAVVVDVLSAGWNREASGLALDLLIRDVLADKFTEGHAAKLSKPVREQPRAMARLLKEANRVKHILSANAEASVNIEGLADDIDFRSRLSREDFEALVEKAGLTSAFGEPVAEALRNAKMKIGDLTSVVLVGGMSRVPLVQAALRAAGVPDSKVAQNVNADEAAVMGAAFYGAEFNPQFRMKSIRAHDGNAYPVVLREKGGKDEVIFPQGPFLQERHERKYKDVHEDFSFEVAYAPSSKSKLDTFAPELYRIELVEIHNHLAGLKERGEIEQVDIDLNVTLVTQPLGIYSVESAWLNVKQKPTSIAGALRSFFNVGAQRVDDDEDDDAVEVIPDATESEAANASEPTVVVNATDDKNATAAAKPKKAKKPTPTDRSIRIVGRAVSVGSNRPMSGSELKTAKDRLYVANVEMRRRAAKEEARNVLEAYIYRARDIVHDENFGAASKRKERDDIAAKAEELSEWLNEREAELAPTDKLKSKLASLQALVSPVEKRMAEQSGRGAAVRRFTKALEETRAFVVQARANLSEALAAGTGSKYSTAELDTLNGNVERDDKWYREGEAKQARKKADEDPVFKVDELDKRVKKLRDTVKRLASRRIPKTRPPKKSKEAKSSSSATSESATASPAASDAPPKHEEL
jgi:hypoxia up-regulated 1